MFIRSARTKSYPHHYFHQRPVRDVGLLRADSDQKATGRGYMSILKISRPEAEVGLSPQRREAENTLRYTRCTVLNCTHKQSEDRLQSPGGRRIGGHSSGSAKCCDCRHVAPCPPNSLRLRLPTALFSSRERVGLV